MNQNLTPIILVSTRYRNQCITTPQVLLPDTSQIPATSARERPAQSAFSFPHTIQPRRTVQTTANTTSHARDQPPCNNAVRYGHQTRCGARRHHNEATGQRRTRGTQRLACGSQPSGVRPKIGNFENQYFSTPRTEAKSFVPTEHTISLQPFGEPNVRATLRRPSNTGVHVRVGCESHQAEI